MSCCPSGASSMVPSEPAADTSPTAQERRSGGVARETAPISTPKPVPATPRPTSNPPPSGNPTSGEPDNAISAKPAT